VRLWDAPSGEEIRRMDVGIAPSYYPALALSHDGARIAALAHIFKTQDSKDHTIRIWEAATGRPLHQLKPDRAAQALRFTPDGRFLLSTGHDSLVVWDADSGREVRRMPVGGSSVGGLDVSPSGRFAATGKEFKVCLWEIATGQLLRELTGHRGHVSAVRFAPDGHTVASASQDGTALIWDMLPAVAADFSADDWTRLSDPDAAKAFPALARLKHHPARAVALLAEHLKPVAAVESEQIKKLVRRLDSDNFAEREEAERELAKLGPGAEGALREALRGAPSVEAQRRIERWLSRHQGEELRTGRALELLEHLATPAARALLADLAKGAPGATLTRAAAEGLRRVERQAPGTPR
jgi:hypothetical protein